MEHVRVNAGHGSSDCGAIGKYKGLTIYERDVVADIGNDMMRYWKRNYVGMTISVGPEKPTGGDFPKRSNGTYNTEAYGTAIGGYYSLHLNASNGSGHGTETWYWHTYGDNRARVVNDVLDNYFTDRDVKLADTNQDGYADFYILRECGFDTIVEFAFIDNESDMEILFTKWDDIIKAVCDAIAKYEGWERKVTVKKYYTEKEVHKSKYTPKNEANWYNYKLSEDKQVYLMSGGPSETTLKKGDWITGYKKTRNGAETVVFESNGIWKWAKMADAPK